jgi:HEAT repeat protein
MTEPFGWASESANPERRSRIGSRAVIALVASLAIMAWTGWKFWDTAIIASARGKIWKALHGNESIRLLKSGDGTFDERLNAVGNLRIVGGDDEIDEAIATLIATLNDESIEVRTMAAQSLGSLVFQTLSRGLKKPWPSEQVKKWKETATEALLKGLSDKDPEFRVAVCTGLQTMFSRDPSLPPSPQLQTAVRQGTVKWNRTTAREYSGSPEEEPPRELVAALKDESAAVRTAASQALARFPFELDSVIPSLVSMLEDSDPAVRRAASGALAVAWPTSVVVPTLIDALKSQNRAARSYSALMLGRIGPEAKEALPGLIAILKEPVDYTPKPRSVFGYDLMDPNPSRESAIALARIAPDRATLQLLIELLSTGNPDEPGVPVRWNYIAEALLEIGPQASEAAPAMIAAIDRLLDSKNPISDVDAVVDAIGRLSRDPTDSAATVGALIRWLDPRFQKWNGRRRAVEILGRLGRAAAPSLPKLKEIQNGKDAHLQAAAAAAIAAIEADSKPSPSVGTSR